jgi:hypothetical protein
VRRRAGHTAILFATWRLRNAPPGPWPPRIVLMCTSWYIVCHVLEKSIAETISLTGHISAMFVTFELQISAVHLTVAKNCRNIQSESQKSVCVNSLLYSTEILFEYSIELELMF